MQTIASDASGCVSQGLMASSVMKTATLDPDFAKLLREIQARNARNPLKIKPNWEEIIGTSRGDEIDREAARLGEEWRRSERLEE
jgi:hypothetical protein